MIKTVFIVGPTASGKTEYSIRLALDLDGEIISADSRLVYKDFNIGTAKPAEEELNKVKHHCVNVASPGNDTDCTLQGIFRIYQSQIYGAF